MSIRQRDLPGFGPVEAASAEALRLLDAAPVLLWVSDERNAATWFNRWWLDFTGRTLEQELGFGWIESVHPDDRDSAAAFCQSHFERREPFRMEFRLRRHDGVYRWMLDNGVPRTSGDGTFMGYAGSCVDITERRQSELEIAMQARVLDSMREGVSVADDDGIIVYTNPAEERMFGYAPGELIGKPLAAQDAHGPDGPDSIVPEMNEQLRARGEWSGDWENVRKDGTRLVTATHITTLQFGGRSYRVCVQEDITEKRRNSARKAFLDEAKRLLISSLAEESALVTLTRHCVPFLADYASVDLLTEDGEIRRVETAHVDPEKERIVRDVWRRYPYRSSDTVGVPEVLRSGQPQFLYDIPEDMWNAFVRDAEHLALLRQLGPRSYICVPLAARGEVYGALSLVMSDSGRTYGPAELEVAVELARRAGIAVDNARLFEAEHRARERAAFLSEMSSVLASSLDYETTLSSVARSIVPALADWCGVDILDADGTVRQLAVAHTDPERAAWARELRHRYPPDLRAPRGLPNVLRTGEAELYPEVPDEMLAAAAVDAEHLEIMRSVGFSSVMIVPLVVRGRTLGAVTFVSAESRRRYGEADLAFAREIARRAAVAVDSARLFREAQEERERADEARELAERASRSKSEFLATMSHEIRTPINAIIGYTQLMQLGVAGAVNEEQGRHLDRIGTSGRHLLRLIEDILDLSKIEAGRLTVGRSHGIAAAAADAAIALIRPQADAKRILLSARCEGSRQATYVGDEQRVQQILVNLLSNAVKFTPVGGTVRVRCGRSPAGPPGVQALDAGPWTCIAVEDSGSGIPPNMLTQIFEPFVQGDGGYTRTHSGTGLGLTISRRLARLMDGDLTAESTPGSGSTFVLWLPGGAQESSGASAPTVRNETHPPISTSETGVANAWRGARSAALGRLVLERLDEIASRHTARLRDSVEAIPDVGLLSDAQLENHLRPWLASLGQCLVLLDAAGGGPSDAQRDAADIQRMISERHGAQRQRLGWDLDALSGEYAILCDVFAALIDSSGDADVEAGRAVLTAILQQAEQASAEGLRAAATASQPARATPLAAHPPGES